MNYDDPDEVGEALSAAVQGVLASYGVMATRHVLLVECVEESGDRVVWSATHDGSTSWDTLGLLMYGVQREQAGVLRAEGD